MPSSQPVEYATLSVSAPSRPGDRGIVVCGDVHLCGPFITANHEGRVRGEVLAAGAAASEEDGENKQGNQIFHGAEP